MSTDRDDVRVLDSEEWRACQRIVHLFEASWRNGERPNLADLLPEAGRFRADLLMELVRAELGLRLRDGEHIRVESYLDRFPDLAADPAAIVDLIAAEFAIRRQLDPALADEEYSQRFPTLAAAINARLRDQPPKKSHVPSKASPSGDFAGFPSVGATLGDFELLDELGQGSFARVFLARQISLGRIVALKVTANTSNEARTLASLEHPHIVAVFSETVDAQRNLRLLCMQYVAGSTLEKSLRELAGVPFADRTGTRWLAAIAGEKAAVQSPLTDCDSVEAICWIVARIAEALAFAHERGVLHRDLKPANVLIDRQGRPLLADFNLSFDANRDDANWIGGTRAYMAPEHLAAFAGQAPPEAVDQRSEVYALGIILFELLTSRLPDGQPSTDDFEPTVAPVLVRTIRRCLEPDPAHRYQSAAALARALEGCRQWQRTQRDLPAAGPLTRMANRHPYLTSIALPLLPHLAGATIDFAFNRLALSAHDGSRDLVSVFSWLALVYTLIVVAVTCTAAIMMTAPLWRIWRPLRRGESVDVDRMIAVRRWTVRIPFWACALSCLGWMPGAVALPLSLAAIDGPLPAHLIVNLGLSFIIAGLIALTYSGYAALFLTLRVGYPELWDDATDMWQSARKELMPVRRWLGTLQLLTGFVPLTAGVGLILSHSSAGQEVLLVTLIVLGMVGIGWAMWLHNYLRRTLQALTGGES